MNPFSYVRAASVTEASRALEADPEARIIAGGTNLVDLMKYGVEHPARVIDVTRIDALRTIEDTPEGGLLIGALVTNTAVAEDTRVVGRYPLLASALLAGATAQLRNAATVGGNLLQRTRCYYFYDTTTACNKREPGSGCPAIVGRNRIHAILGASSHCIATHPSDMCVALAALEATVRVTGPEGERTIPMAEFHRLPGEMPQLDTTLRQGEVITLVALPPQAYARNHTYLKLRDRLSYAFALVSVAVGLKMDGDQIARARLALGGVAHKPWRDLEAEAMLEGKAASRDAFAAVADHILRDARGYGDNSFKIELARRAIIRALSQAVAGTPQSQTDKRIR